MLVSTLVSHVIHSPTQAEHRLAVLLYEGLTLIQIRSRYKSESGRGSDIFGPFFCRILDTTAWPEMPLLLI